MPFRQHDVQHMDGPLPRGPGSDPIVDAPQTHKLNVEKVVVWVGMCVVPWVIIAGIVWLIYG